MDLSQETIPYMQLHAMPGQVEVRHKEDDWTGVTDTTVRRKLQNRLNQRAYRRRRAQLGSPAEASSESLNPDPASCVKMTQGQRLNPSCTRRVCRLGSSESIVMMRCFQAEAYAEYLLGTPRLCHLPTLVGLNVFHALARNAASLGVGNRWMIYEAVSPFCQQGPDWPFAATTATPVSSVSCPHNLRPTELQKTVSHHPWIDLFPLPQMRDNILMAISNSETFDEDELCYDLVDVDASVSSEKASLISWGELWDPRAWEVTEQFLRKWGWLLNGCDEILQATNHWRRKRGEKGLHVQLEIAPGHKSYQQ